jgi:exodeoxyribonuclease V beta subunit
MKNLNLNDIDTSGLTLIEASAGTGKTWTITALYILLVLEQRMRPEEILVVTYTKAATAELRDRIRKRLADTLELYASGREPVDELEQLLLTTRCINADAAQKLLTRALYSFDDAAIFTIHGFCQRALLENAFESGSLFDSEITSDQSAIVSQVCDDFWRSRIMTEEGPFLELLVIDGYTPEKLAAPFAGHFQNPDLQIIPEASNPDLTPLTEQRDYLLPPVATMWQSERSAITRQLNQANLNQTSYKPAQIEAAAAKLDVCLSSGSLQYGCDGLALFSTAKIRSGTKKGSTQPSHPFFELCQQLHDAAMQVDDAYKQKLIHLQTALQGWLRVELAQRKKGLNLRSYDDLLLDLHLALQGSGGEHLAVALRERYHAALIDEFQDTDPLQWRIFARMAGFGSAHQPEPEQSQRAYPLFLIGDPKQAIYSFRGADIQAYIAAALATEVDRRWTLDTNRRSTKPLVRAVNTLFRTDDPFLCRAIAFTDVQSGRNKQQKLMQNGSLVEQPLRFWLYQREDQTKVAAKGAVRTATVTATVAEIARLLDGSFEIIGKNNTRRLLKPGDIAVLVKAHYQADQIQAALTSLGIPSVQHGSATIFGTREALDILRILRAAADPTRSALIREALLSAVIGLSANEVFAMGSDDEVWERWLLRFRTLHDAARTGGVIAITPHLLGECGVRKQALVHAGGERRMTNILHCMELLHGAEQEHGIGIEASIIWLERRINGEQQDETALLRLETDDNAVTLSTIHASKGLEYPVVFLPFAWDPPSNRNSRVLFHADDGSLVLDLGSDKREKENKQRAKEEQEAEAVRLLYVAVTRAEFLCYVTWGAISGAFGSPLRRLLHGTNFKDAKSFGATDDKDIMNGLSALADSSIQEGNAVAMSVEFMPVNIVPPAYCPDQDIATIYSCRELQRMIATDWRVSSFSSIVSGSERTFQPHDHDALPSHAPSSDFDRMATTDGLSIFDFPRGAEAGACLHELFEHLDFSRASESSLEGSTLDCLQRNGYGQQWLPAVTRMIREVITTPLIPAAPEFSLARLRPDSWRTELEFFLPIGRLSGSLLREVFTGLLTPDLHGNFHEILSMLQVQESRGMLHGFIDMIFEHSDHYYIIDWKSNHLGNQRDDYHQSALRQSMAQHAYILQYHLYTLALDRLLSLRLPDYDYATHFGGAIYIYLRGVSADRSDNGIFRDRPTPEFIQRANKILLT